MIFKGIRGDNVRKCTDDVRFQTGLMGEQEALFISCSIKEIPPIFRKLRTQGSAGGEFITALIAGVVGVSLYPFEFYLMFPVNYQKFLPEIRIFLFGKSLLFPA